jgi:vancomycin resistance protein YoaR
VQDGEVRVKESRDGRTVDEARLLGSLENGLLREGERSYEVPLAAQKPQLTTEQARKLRPTEMLGSYRTNYQMVYDGPERVENLQIASNAINNTALAPGEVFSVNELAAPLDYHATKVIVEGRETLADGGGLCQVASTLYMAANYAGLEVLERHPHHAALPYIRPGLDATVWFGSLDMKFRNTTDAYVLVREYVAGDGYIYAEVWGRPNGTEVSMTSRPTYEGPDAASWVTYKTVKEDGKVVFDDVLHTDTYKSLIDKDGREVPPSEIVPAPVNP